MKKNPTNSGELYMSSYAYPSLKYYFMWVSAQENININDKSMGGKY